LGFGHWTLGRATKSGAACLGAGLLLLANCGTSGPQLTNLRCRQSPCQDPEDPFTLRLAVDFSDGTGTMGQGSLELFTNGNLLEGVSLSDLFTAQGVPATATSGTLELDEPVSLTTITQGEQFTVGLQARNGVQQSSNTPTLSLTLTLGGR
jgi:hypothetical protein